MIDIMFILPLVFIAGIVVFMKSEGGLRAIALIVSLTAAVFWIVLEESSMIDAHDSFIKISEQSMTAMALLEDDKALTVVYLNDAAKNFYHMKESEETEEEDKEDKKKSKLVAKDLVEKRWSNRPFKQFQNTVVRLLENKINELEKQDKNEEANVRRAELKEARTMDEVSLKKKYLDKIIDYELKEITTTIAKLKDGDILDKDLPITLEARLATDAGKKGKFEIAQLTAVPIKQKSPGRQALLDVLRWIRGLFTEGKEAIGVTERYSGYLLTVMTLDLDRCKDVDTITAIRDRLSYKLTPTPTAITP